MWLPMERGILISEARRSIWLLRIRPNAAKPLGSFFTVQPKNDPKHIAKRTQDILKAKKLNVLQWPHQSPDVDPERASFQLLKVN